MSVLRPRGVDSVADGQAGRPARADEWALDHPGVWEHLTASTYPDGSTRETSTLTIFCEDGRIKVCLSDRDRGEVAFLSGESVEGTLDALEAGLAQGALDWRKQRGKPRAR